MTKEEIKEFLLLPIIVDESVEGFSVVRDCNTGKKMIISGQKYQGMADADMSNIALDFYAKIYKDFYMNENTFHILNEENQLCSEQIAGDTINSFRQVTNRKECSQAKREEWQSQYHCLANFWILPKKVGRMCGKLSKATVAKDYLDNFLIVLEARFDEYKKTYPYYFENIESIQAFYQMHGFEDNACDCVVKSKEEYNVIKKMNAEERISRMQKFLDWRADYLSREYKEQLEGLFENIYIL